MEHPVGLPLCWCRDRGAYRDTRRGVCPVGRDHIAMHWPVAIRIAVATHFPITTGFAIATRFPVATELLSQCPSSSQWYRDSLGGCDSACVCLGCSVVPVGVSASAPGLASPQDLQVGNAAGYLAAFTIRACLGCPTALLRVHACLVLDPHPREPIEGVLLATSMLELAAELVNSRAEGKMSSSSLFRGGEVGARLASRGHGRHVPLLAASGGGLVAVVVMRFPHDASKYDSCAEGCFRIVPDSVARGSSSRELSVERVAEAVVALCVVSSSEIECSELLYRSELRVVLCKFSGSSDPWVAMRTSGSLAGVREVGSLQLVSECGSIEIYEDLITIVVPKKGVQLPCEFYVSAAVGCSCCCIACVESVVARCVYAAVVRLAVDSLTVVFLVWRTTAGKSRHALRHLSVVVVGLVLTGFAVALPFGLRCIAWLPCVLGLRCAVGFASAFWRVFPEWCLGGFGGGSPRTGLHYFCSSAYYGSPFVTFGGGSSQECSMFVSGHRCVVPVVLSVPFGWTAFCVSGRCTGQTALLFAPKFSVVLVGLCVSSWCEWFASFLAPDVLLQMVVACVSVALLCTDFLAWLARASVISVCASACAMEAFHLSVRFCWLGPAWPVVPIQACGSLCVALGGSLHRVFMLECSVLCRLEPWSIVLYLGWLPVLVIAPCVVPCHLIMSFVALSVVHQALVVAYVLVFPLALGASVFDCGTLLQFGSL
ncbi:hypothetical protein Taro_039103 [Colocasia esculenta]|uniref:Uncharacterized protein n=1 Tax=Colocasia esculenta TaxID=4460 RepID=A0A843W8F7_COLES|nr:hypothetical protein [Colocasia esculenta]